MTGTRPCPGCLGADARPFSEHNGFDVLSCRGCGTLFTAQLPAAGAAYDYDAYYDEQNLEVPAFVQQRLREIVAGFATDRSLNRWLDVGCGAGTLIRAAAEEGWVVTGTEVAPPAAEALRAQGLDVRVGDLRELDLPANGFDVVSLVEVLEHVPDPDAQLEACASLLRPGGALYVTTPHGRGLSARLLHERWSVIAPPEHLQLFSAHGLRTAAARNGLVTRSLRAHGADPRALVSGLRARRDPAAAPVAGCDRVEGAYALNEALSSRRLGAVVKSLVNGVLSATRLGDGLKLVAERPAR